MYMYGCMIIWLYVMVSMIIHNDIGSAVQSDRVNEKVACEPVIAHPMLDS